MLDPNDKKTLEHDAEVERLRSIGANLNGATREELIQILNDQEASRKQGGVVDYLYAKKGLMHFAFVKTPAKILNIGSIRDSQKIWKDTFRALSAPICPKCGKGTLMYNLKSSPNFETGDVKWFCNNFKSCDFTVQAQPSLMGVANDDLRSKLDYSERSSWKHQWLNLKDDEKQELINSHLEKALLFRAGFFAIFLMYFTVFSLGNFGKASLFFTMPICFVFAVVQNILFKKFEFDRFLVIGLSFFIVISILSMFFIKFWFGGLNVIILLAFAQLLSLKWCYRAWQIKTGQTGFVDWFSHAESFYSVRWVDGKGVINE